MQPGSNLIVRGECVVHLRARLMDLLVCLAERAGTVVSKDEILAAVWGEKILAESVLTRTLAELRRELGDDPRKPTFIETITKRGYRLVTPVEWVEPGTGGAGRPCAVFVVSFAGHRIQLREGESVIGRSADAAVRVASLSVSRHHARIIVSAGCAWIEDLGSKNGTLLNGRRARGRVELTDGARLEVGPEVMIFRVLDPECTTESAVVLDGASA